MCFTCMLFGSNMCSGNVKHLDMKINTQACNYNYKNYIGLAMLGQVHTRLQLETCTQSIKKYEQVNNQYRFSRFESFVEPKN